MNGPPVSVRRSRRQIWQTLVWGVLWAVSIIALEGAGVSILNGEPSPVLSFWLFQFGFMGWWAAGCGYVLLARNAVSCGGGWRLVPGWLAVSVTWGILAPAWFELSGAIQGLDTRSYPMAGVIVHDVWICVLYGGFLTLAYAFAFRTERMRALLQDAAIARGRTTALRGEAELEAMQGLVDPALLLDVMGDVEAYYRRSPRDADDLLGRLVEFLRYAMPGLKGRTSTLQVELQLASAYVRLHAGRTARAGSPDGWRIDEADHLPQIAFPSRLMLPLLALKAAHARPRLSVRLIQGGVRLEIDDLGADVPDSFTQAARSCLSSLAGTRFTLQVDSTRVPQLVLGLFSFEGGHDGPR